MKKQYLYHEDDICPICKQGQLSFQPDESLGGCTCFLGHPPCSYCISTELTCDTCKTKFDESLYHGFIDTNYFWKNNKMN